MERSRARVRVASRPTPMWVGPPWGIDHVQIDEVDANGLETSLHVGLWMLHTSADQRSADVCVWPRPPWQEG